MTAFEPNAVDTAVSEGSLFIPLIDFGLFLSGSESERRAVAHAVVDGFKNAGFIYLKDHGISPETLKTVFGSSADFFKLSKEQKDALGWYSPRANRGYTAQGREKVTLLTDKTDINELRAKNPDLKESFEIGRDDEPEYPNRWPESKPEFKATMMDFFSTCRNLHMEVMRSIALGMELPEENFFDSFCDKGDNTLRLLHYPRTPADVFKKNVGQVRASAHTDYGSITLLFQDSRGGLQVRSPQGTYVNATPIEGTIVVNAGDLLARWSNDRVKSTEHRVVEPPSEAEDGYYPPRYSIAYFCNPNFDREIEALPGTYASEAEKKYGTINSGEYLFQRLEATY